LHDQRNTAAVDFGVEREPLAIGAAGQRLKAVQRPRLANPLGYDGVQPHRELTVVFCFLMPDIIHSPAVYGH
jgi:hypothetical protein